MKKLIVGGLAALAIGLGAAPTALAEPSPEPPPCLPFGIPGHPVDSQLSGMQPGTDPATASGPGGDTMKRLVIGALAVLAIGLGHG